MIAELNRTLQTRPDRSRWSDAFRRRGPGKGTLAKGNAFLAFHGSVAIDAVGVAILKHLGSNDNIMKPKIFAQSRCQGCGTGVGRLIACEHPPGGCDDKTPEYRGRIEEILKQG